MKCCTPNPRKKGKQIERAIGQVQRGEKRLTELSRALRGNREIVMESVTQFGWTLEHASAELKADKEIVLAAVAQNVYATILDTGELKDDPKFRNQINYIRQEDGMTRTKLLTLYKKLLQINLEKNQQRLALAKLLSSRLSIAAPVSNKVRLTEDILEEIVKKPPLAYSSFEKCVDLFMEHKSACITSDTTIETLIEELIAFRGRGVSETEPLLPDCRAATMRQKFCDGSA